MIIWGGLNAKDEALDSGARYNPRTDTWIELPSPPKGIAKGRSVAVWTGSELLVWGAAESWGAAGGARWSPATDQWELLRTGGTPPAKAGALGVWTGRELVVWGHGFFGYEEQADGGQFVAAEGKWASARLTGGPRPRDYASSAWTGREFIVWGGSYLLPRSSYDVLDDGAGYDPVAEQWRSLPPSPLDARRGHTSVWTGSELLIFGGDTRPYASRTGRGIVNDGARYRPPC
jgi:hypothetical protein